MFQRFYQYLFLFKEYVIFILLMTIAIVLLILNDNTQIRFIRSMTVGAIGAVQQTFSFIPNLTSLQRENELLRRVNVNLADEVNQLRESRLENIRLRSMLALKETSAIHLQPVKIIGKNLNLLRNTITLNAGKNNGLNYGNPIVTGEGLVGRVIGTSGGYAIAQIILNMDFRISAKIQRSRVDGIVAWDGRTLILKEMAKSLDVQEGDAVITSEYSNAFPPGIKIGIISKIADIPNSLFKKVELVPAVNFTMTEEVYVMDFVPSLERMMLEQERK